MEVDTLLELSGNQRLELNCSLLLSKQVTGIKCINSTHDMTFDALHLRVASDTQTIVFDSFLVVPKNVFLPFVRPKIISNASTDGLGICHL